MLQAPVQKCQRSISIALALQYELERAYHTYGQQVAAQHRLVSEAKRLSGDASTSAPLGNGMLS
jgi:hypothetical protein